MTELELKYGCNPNQKPARIFMEEGAAYPGAQRQARLHQLYGRLQLLAAGEGAEGGHRPARRRLLQARLPRRRRRGRASPTWSGRSTLPRGWSSPHRLRLCPRPGADRLCSYGDWAALSDVCDEQTRPLSGPGGLRRRHRPGYTDEGPGDPQNQAQGRLQWSRSTQLCPQGRGAQDVFGITFEQGHNNFEINAALLDNMVTDNKDLPEAAKRDLILALITLKYTQSNSVCYAKDGQAIGVGAGQQSRIHCTRLAGNKADNWFLRQHPKVLGLPSWTASAVPDRDNAIDVYISDEYEDVLADGVWQNTFQVRRRS